MVGEVRHRTATPATANDTPKQPAPLTPAILAKIQAKRTAAIARRNARLALPPPPPHIWHPIDIGSNDPPDVATPPVTGPRGGGRPELTNRRAKEVATVQPSHPDNWKWRNDKSLSKLDVSHRKAGWWAVDTNNPNSWQTGGSAYMAESTADVILTQEVKIAEGYPQEVAEQAARTAKWKVSIEPCLITAAGGKSAGTAVATRSYIGMSTPPGRRHFAAPSSQR